MKYLAAALAVAPKKDVRYYIVGVLYDHADRCWVATDGNCLIRTPDGTALIEGATGDLILPREFVDALVKTKQKTPGLIVSGEWVESGALRCKPVDGKFPDWRRVVPATVSGEVAQFDVEILAKLVAANKALGLRQSGQLVIGHNGRSGARVKLQSGCLGVVMPFDPVKGGPTD